MKNFPKNQTAIKHIKSEPQSHSEAVKSAKKIGDCSWLYAENKKYIIFEAQQIYWKCFPCVKANQPNHQ